MNNFFIKIRFPLTPRKITPNYISEPQGPGTSKLDWRYFEYNKNDRNELQVLKNLLKVTGTKMAKKLNNFEKLDRKKNRIQACAEPSDLLITGQVS